jgi:hypothetical protein
MILQMADGLTQHAPYPGASPFSIIYDSGSPVVQIVQSNPSF